MNRKHRKRKPRIDALLEPWLEALIDDYANHHNLKDESGDYIKTQALHGAVKEKCELAAMVSKAWIDRDVWKSRAEKAICLFGENPQYCDAWKKFLKNVEPPPK